MGSIASEGVSTHMTVSTSATDDHLVKMEDPRVLIVISDPGERLSLQTELERLGYVVSLAVCDQSALTTYLSEQPDVVLVDDALPEGQAFTATETIKEVAGENFVTVTYLANFSAEDSITRAVTAGADDFLSKPLNGTILAAKIEGYVRSSRLHAIRRMQQEALAQHNEQIHFDQQVAEKMFRQMLRSGQLNLPSIKYSVSPMAIFNGDLLLAASTPSGALNILLGDFTGHGLAAALGTLPASEIFYGMSAKGFSIGEIIAEINHRLREMLPTGLFLATAIIQVDPQRGRLYAWNGGVPDLLVRGKDGIKYRISSNSIPLGIVETEHLDCAVVTHEIESGDRIYMYTDGVVEAYNARGQQFGQMRLDTIISGHKDAEDVFEAIGRALDYYRAGAEQTDDITMIEVQIDDRLKESVSSLGDHKQVTRKPTGWKVAMTLQADALREIDPMPLLTQVMMELQGMYEHKARIYTVLSELLSNAIDHGILMLDSEMKRTANGFMDYYQLREEKLKTLSEAQVTIELEHVPSSAGGDLTIRVQDSGTGFDLAREEIHLESNLGNSGRGISLVRTLCESLQHSDEGRCVEAVYRWR